FGGLGDPDPRGVEADLHRMGVGHYPDVRDCLSTAGLPDAVH
ncbi:hypothetical protein A2U01_0105819, partial [Trifolium medium]|nr:hypothetical protein [Trifolium medium]